MRTYIKSITFGLLIIGCAHINAYVFRFHNFTNDTLDIAFKLAGIWEPDNQLKVKPMSTDALHIEGRKIFFCFDTATLRVHKNGVEQQVIVLVPLYQQVRDKIMQEVKNGGRATIHQGDFEQKLGACHDTEFNIVADLNGVLWAIAHNKW